MISPHPSPFHPGWDETLLPELDKDYMKSLFIFLDKEKSRG